MSFQFPDLIALKALVGPHDTPPLLLMLIRNDLRFPGKAFFRTFQKEIPSFGDVIGGSEIIEQPGDSKSGAVPNLTLIKDLTNQ